MASCGEGPDPYPLALNPKVGSCGEGPDSRRQCMWREHQVGQVQLRRLHSISGFEFRVSGFGFRVLGLVVTWANERVVVVLFWV